MIRQLIRAYRKKILIDVSTQKDFFLAYCSACVRNHRRVLANIRRVVAWARTNDMRVISTCEVYPNNNGGSAVNYCLDGTDGQRKIHYTLLSNRMSFAADGNTDLPFDVLRRYRQVILHKRCADPFDEPRIERLLSEVRANEFVLIGAIAEGAVKAMALGLLQRGKKVTVVVDAVGTHNRKQARMALRKIEAKGARLVETKSFAGKSHLRRVGICHCKACQGQTPKQSFGFEDEN